MPRRKRNLNKSTCECFNAHGTKAECERQAFLATRRGPDDKHRAIAAQVLTCSEMAKILVGNQDYQVFMVHKNLLTLHSGYFANLFNEREPDVGNEVEVQNEPSLFANFVSWIYSGDFLRLKDGALMPEAYELWELGDFLKAPAFQNFCMDMYRHSCRQVMEPGPDKAVEVGPCVQAIKQIYGHTPRATLLRSFTVDTLSYKNPLQVNERGSPAWEEWKSLLTGQISTETWSKNFQEDFVLQAGKDWEGIPPWDDRRRENYMEEETPMEERWETQILTARLKDEIERSALIKADVHSIIEWAHLQRHKF